MTSSAGRSCRRDATTNVSAAERSLLDSPLADVQLTLPTPFPGTPLRARLAAEGRLLPDRDWSHHTLFDVCYQPDAMTVAELELGFRRALQRLFAPDAARTRAI